MSENWCEVMAVLAEKIRTLKTEVYLKDYEISKLTAENVELKQRVAELETDLKMAIVKD